MARAVTPSRMVAYDAFVRVMENHQNPDAALDDLCNKLEKPLKRLDRNLCKELLYGGLRWYSKILWILQNTSSRDLGGVTPEIRAALVLGTYQIFYMDKIPDRAAVNESVEYIRFKGQANAVNFVNGILRQIARRAQYFQKPDKILKPVEYLSLQYAHPQWLVNRWHEHFSTERLQGMLVGNNQQPPWFIRVNTLKTGFEEIHLLQQRLLRDEKLATDRRPLRTALELKAAPAMEPESLFGQGYYTIQDISSQLIGYLVDPKPEQLIVDAASGKGGKLGHLFELSKGKAKLLAIEPKGDQVALAQETTRRMGYDVYPESTPIEWIQKDFQEWRPEPLQAPDKILIDAPCSGLGVIRRHPEGKWLKKEMLIRTMAEVQKSMLSHGIEILKPGGELIYSVCSFEPEETIHHLNFIKDKFGDKVELVSPVSRLPDYFKRYVTRDNLFMVYPGNQDEMDGFGAFILKKLG